MSDLTPIEAYMAEPSRLPMIQDAQDAYNAWKEVRDRFRAMASDSLSEEMNAQNHMNCLEHRLKELGAWKE